MVKLSEIDKNGKRLAVDRSVLASTINVLEIKKPGEHVPDVKKPDDYVPDVQKPHGNVPDDVKKPDDYVPDVEKSGDINGLTCDTIVLD